MMFLSWVVWALKHFLPFLQKRPSLGRALFGNRFASSSGANVEIRKDYLRLFFAIFTLPAQIRIIIDMFLCTKNRNIYFQESILAIFCRKRSKLKNLPKQ
jgi:hypothetical protein